jgi:hypothetical protein
MPTNTYVALATQTLGSSTSTVTFSSINQGYTDLVLVIANAQNLTGNSDVLMRFNSDSGSNYSATVLTGDGSSASSARRTNSTSVILNYFNFLNSSPATQFNVSIQNYSNATTQKTVLIRSNRAASATEAIVGVWRATPAAITQIDLTLSSSQFAAGSTFSLYGIAAEGQGYATGGYVTSDANYYYHTFTSSGTFIPQRSLTCDYLVVAGGGSGGSRIGGGGGAGGLRSTVTATGGGGSLESALSLASGTSYTVTVGAGGAAVTSTPGTKGNNGSNSVFSTITSTGGGGGGAYIASTGQDGNAGGSGGGAGFNTRTAGAGTANQGFAGGNGAGTTNSAGGGGAGAAAATAPANASNGGAGGAGVAVSITGSSVTYAGGGGGSGDSGIGGAGGTGGGGAGSVNNSNATAGTINTGGGGGGARNSSDTTNVTSGAGGSGLVIVRYAK